jgi:acyl dehydratase
MNNLLHYEDFPPGRVFDCGTYHVSKDEILEFARQFDPQPHHLDEEAGKKSLLGGLSASGWHVCSIAMRMFADAVILKSANRGGPGAPEGRWLRPVRPGDILRMEAHVLEARISNSRPGIGLVTFEWKLFNATEQVTSVTVITMPARRSVT